MFDLREDGTIHIDFGGDAPVSVRRPKVGALKRVRSEMARIADKTTDYLAGLEPSVLADLEETEDTDRLTKAQYARKAEERYEADTLEWWTFVLSGDESFAGLAEGTVPADLDEWPVELTNPVSAGWAIAHWKSVPLARGGTLVPPK